MKRDQVFQLSVCQPYWYFAEQVCLIGHDRWKAALSRALVICQAGGKICTTGKIRQ